MAKSAKYPRPLPNFVLLKVPARKKEDIKGFVVVKDREKDNRSWAQEGRVLAIGVNKNGFVFRNEHDEIGTKPKFKVGDTIYYSSFTEQRIDNKYAFIKYSDILGIKN